MSVSAAEPPAYVLTEEQVEALLSAIENTPAARGGKTSEVTEQAALYLTSIDSADAKEQLAQALADQSDIDQIDTDLASFAQILADFGEQTAGDETPEVQQTEKRLATVVAMIQRRRNALSDEINITIAPIATNVAENRPAQPTPAPTARTDVVGAANESGPQTSFFEEGWFRFAAFAFLSLIILLAVVGIVRWLQNKNEIADQQQNDESSSAVAAADGGQQSSLII